MTMRLSLVLTNVFGIEEQADRASSEDDAASAAYPAFMVYAPLSRIKVFSGRRRAGTSGDDFVAFVEARAFVVTIIVSGRTLAG